MTIGDGQGRGRINNDDSTALNDVLQAEGDAGTTAYTFTVALSEPSDRNVTVVVGSADDRATTADGDYETVNGKTLTFTVGGALTQTVAANVIGDTKVEHDETFFMQLSDARDDGASDNTRLSLADVQGLGTLQNDDAAIVTVSSVSNLEANSPFVFDVALSQPVDDEVTVEFSTVDGTATVADNDYIAVTDQIVTFSAGTTLQSVTVDITDDARLEIEETFAVALADLDANGRNVTLGGPATGVIEDDEPLPDLSIGDVVKAENDGVFTFTVTLSPVRS